MNNNILSAYSALTFFEKADVRSRLEKPLSREDFVCIGRLLGLLLCEGPDTGISGIEDAESILQSYLKRMERQNPDLADYEHCLDIEEYACEQQNQSLADLCNTYLQSDSCHTVVCQAVEKGEEIELAIHLGIEYGAPLLHCLENQFDQTYYKISHLMDEVYYADKAIELYTSRLPLKQMQTGPADEM